MNPTRTFFSVAAALFALALSSARAAVITSNDFNAFAAAVESASAGEIFTFNLGSNSTIFFERSILIPTTNLTFNGQEAVTFDGQDTTGMFHIPTTSSAGFSGFTFQHGSRFEGGAILVNGQVTVSDSLFFDNFASNTGGAISANNTTGSITVTNSTFLQNSVNNSGGAITSSGKLNVFGSTFRENTANNASGAINAASWGGEMRISSSLFVGNDVGNSSGALDVAAQNFPIIIENSTFTQNHADNSSGAIGISGPGQVFLRNSTVWQNTASVGPGVSTGEAARVTIDSSLLARNGGSDLRTSFGDVVTVRNSLIGSNGGNGLVDGANGNLVGNGTNVRGYPITQLLFPLADNGGLTDTMALRVQGSNINPAVNAGSNPGGLLYDQRGAPYLRVSGGQTDIGAFERQIVVPEPSASTIALLGASVLLLAMRRRGRPRCGS